MAVTRINGSKRLGEKTIVEKLFDDKSVSTRAIADAAITGVKVDSTENFTITKLTAGGKITANDELEVAKATALKDTLTVDKNVEAKADLKVDSNMNIGGDVVIKGNLQVDGDQIIANTATMDVEDKNITVSKGGNTAAMNGAGITVDNTDSDGNKGSIIFDSSANSYWKAGLEGSEIEVGVLTGSQTFADKTYKLVGDKIESKDNIEDALRALDSKVNGGTAFKLEEGDTSSSNYKDSDSNENGHATWDVGEEIKDDSPVHVYSSGTRLRSGTEDSDGNISNDYSVDYGAGKVLFAEKPDGNIIVEYIKA